MQQMEGSEHNIDAATPRHPLVSVIIPAYNVAPYIGEALDSVFAQTFTDYEIIVVNDGSPDIDDLDRVVAPYLNRITYLKQENRGLAGARNRAIRAAQGSLIALLDADDAWLPNYLEVQVRLLQDDQSIDVLYSNAVIFGNALEQNKRFMDLCPSEGEVTFERLMSQECNVMVSAIMRREAIERAGLFDESLRSVEDFDLWVRIVKQGGRIAYHRQVLVRYRRRPGSLSSDPIWMCKHILRVLDKTRAMNLSASERAALERAHLRFHATLRLHEGKRAFFEGNTNGAIEGLTEAHRFFRDRKTALTLKLLRFAPRLLLRAYDLRDRVAFGISTKY